MIPITPKKPAPTEIFEKTLGQNVPQIELIPSEKLDKLLKQFAPKPFYLNPSFYLSLFAICISLGAMFLSYIDSPISTYTSPKVEYKYKICQTLEKPTDSNYLKTMEGFIENTSKYPVYDLFVDIGHFSETPANIVVSGGINYTIEQNDGFGALIKFPLFPPDYKCYFIVQSRPIVTAEELSFTKRLPMIISVYSKHGYGVFRKIK